MLLPLVSAIVIFILAETGCLAFSARAIARLAALGSFSRMFAVLPLTIVWVTVLSMYALALAAPTCGTRTVARAVMRQVSSGQRTRTQTVGTSFCERLPESFAAGAVTSFGIAGEDGVVDAGGGVDAGVGVGGAGAVVSTIHVRVGGVGSVLPAASIARAARVCAPSASPVSSLGDRHAAQAPASSLHSNVDAASEEENAKLDDAEAVVPEGPERIVVSGATVSRANVLLAGVASVLLA